MFVFLLVITFAVSLMACDLVARLFRSPVGAILNRLVGSELADAWKRYLVFAIYVVGVSGGVRIWDLEKYITGRGPDETPIILTGERCALELYRTIITTLQSTAWMLLVFFVFSLIAFVIMKGFEMRRAKAEAEHELPRESTRTPTERMSTPSRWRSSRGIAERSPSGQPDTEA
jgi:hypothetical protein